LASNVHGFSIFHDILKYIFFIVIFANLQST
jgi:hypothetical protein